jgi:hypothetical protein
MPTDQNAGRRRLTRQVRVLTLGSSGMAAAATVALTVVIAGNQDAAPSGPNTVTPAIGSATTGSSDNSGTSAPTSAVPSTAAGTSADGGSTAQDQRIVVPPAPRPGGQGNSHAGSGGS